jgi:hypothetical protein
MAAQCSHCEQPLVNDDGNLYALRIGFVTETGARVSDLTDTQIEAWVDALARKIGTTRTGGLRMNASHNPLPSEVLWSKRFVEDFAAALAAASIPADPPALWECPDCAFSFDASHRDETTNYFLEPVYSCPNCAEARLSAEVARLRAALTDVLRVAERMPRQDSPLYRQQIRDFIETIQDAKAMLRAADPETP